MSTLATPARLPADRAWPIAGLRGLRLGWMVQPVAIFAATRGFVFVAGYLANVALPSHAGEGFYHLVPSNLLLDIWARWDSAYYVTIARDGYTFTAGQLRDVAFFPFYPLLMRLVSAVTTNNLVLAGVLVSNISFLGALLVLNRLTHLEFGDSGTAERAVFYLAAFPSSVFFSAVYTESTFLLLAVAALYCARRQWWLAAGILATLASATRVIGIVLWPVLVLEWLRRNGWTLSALRDPVVFRRLVSRSARASGSLLAISLTPLGLASYAVFLGTIFQDPIAFWSAQALWDKDSRGPLGTVLNTFDSMQWGNAWTGADLYWNAPLDLAALAMGLVIGVSVFRRLGASYGLFTLLGVLIPAWSSTVSMLRYVVVLFPLFMLLGYWSRRPLVDQAITAVFLVLLGVSTAIFVNWVFLA